MSDTTHTIKTFSVTTPYDQNLRMTRWQRGGDPEPVLWLHLYESSDDPPLDPDEHLEFFNGIALFAEDALALGTALRLAAKKIIEATP